MRTATTILKRYGLGPPPPGKTHYYDGCPQCSDKPARQGDEVPF
jgi:hypothetical protein